MSQSNLEIQHEIYAWVEKNDCRSATIVYRYARGKYFQWLQVMRDKEFYSALKLFIQSRDREQKAKGIAAPEGMSLYKAGGGMINPLELKIDENR